jgi:inner membrane protein
MIKPQERYRGIFKTTVYGSQVKLKGHFSPVNFLTLSIDSSTLELDKAKVLIGIKDVRGVTKASNLTWAGQSLGLQPGIPVGQFMQSGIYAPVKANVASKVPFEIALDLNGSRDLKIFPAGKQTDVKLNSVWQTPSFVGNYLPVQRNISDKGFDATLQVSPFARSFKNQWIDSSSETLSSIEGSALGVSLLSSVDHYRQSDRAVKYGILFLTLTFVTYFLFEMLTKSWLNPFHYILVGGALCLFYLLLLSFSEVIGFMWAYLISSVATSALIGWFT